MALHNERNFGNVTLQREFKPPAPFNSVFQAGARRSSLELGPFAGSGTLFLPNRSLRYVKQDLPTAYAESYNLSLQRRGGSELALGSGLFSGSHGVQSLFDRDFNQRAWVTNTSAPPGGE